MNLSEKIVQLRKSRGLSQEQLAESLNVSRQAVSRWEMGSAMPDAGNIRQISKLFGVTADYLLNDDREADANVPHTETSPAAAAKISSLKTKLHLIAGICFTVGAVSSVVGIIESSSRTQSRISWLTAILTALCAAAQFYIYFRSRTGSTQPDDR